MFFYDLGIEGFFDLRVMIRFRKDFLIMDDGENVIERFQMFEKLIVELNELWEEKFRRIEVVRKER